MTLVDWLDWLVRILRPKPPPPPVNTVWRVSNGAVTIECDLRSASAIRNIWLGTKNLVASPDHGAQVQTAVSMDGMGEAKNPTEAGSVNDGNKPTSSSKVIEVHVVDKTISAKSQLCYWIPYQGKTLSDITLDKKIELGWNGLWNVIRDDRTLHVASDYANGFIECLTGYLVLDVNLLYEFDPATEKIKQLAYQASEFFDPSKIVNSDLPIIVAAADGAYAMGVYPRTGYGTGFWGGAGFYSNKWTCGQPHGDFPAGDYKWTVFMIVGTLEEVRRTLPKVLEAAGDVQT